MKKGNIVSIIEHQRQHERDILQPIKETSDDLGIAIEHLIARMRELRSMARSGTE